MTIPSTPFARWLARCLALLAVLFAMGIGPGMVGDTGRIFAVIAFGLGLLICLPQSGLVSALVGGAILGCTGLASAPLPGLPGGAVVALGGVAAMVIASRGLVVPIPWLLGTTVFLALRLAGQSVDAVPAAAGALAYGYDAIAGWVLATTPRWGANPAGVWLLVLGLSLFAAEATSGALGQRSGWRLIALLCTPLATVIVGVWLTAHVHGSNATVFANAPFAVQFLAVPWIAAFGLNNVLPSSLWRQQLRQAPARWATAAVAAVLVLTALLTPVGGRDSAPDAVTRPRVTFVRGSEFNDFSKPTWERLGFASAGMYGALLDLLEASGRQTTVHEGELDESVLAKSETIVLINHSTETSTELVANVERFVADGGRLLVLGDHTDLFGQMGPTNALLAPYGIQIRFDTPMETTPGLSGSLRIRSTGMFPGEIDGLYTQILHGASLRVRSPARPVIVGEAMFGDAGNRANGGTGAFLGNYAIAPATEGIGDLTLAATCAFGKGRVAVFGDTSSFQTIALGRSTAFALDVFDWLETRTDYGLRQRWLLQLFALAAVVMLALPRLAPLGSLLGPVTLAIILLTTAPRRTDISNARAIDSLPDTPVLLVHSGSVPYWRREQFHDKSLEGLLVCGNRQGMVSILGDLAAVSDLGQAAKIVVLADARPLDGALVRGLDQYVRDGGSLLVASGFEERAGVEQLLDNFGIRIRSQPLGAAPILPDSMRMTYRGVKFAEAWGLEVGSTTATEALYAYEQQPIVARRTVGKGSVVLMYGGTWPDPIALTVRRS